MTRKHLVIAALLVFCSVLVPSVIQASSLTDIVEDDWAYFALAELGRGRPIAEFLIPHEMTRYQGALLVARLIEYIDGGEPSISRRFGLSREVLLDDMIQAYNSRVAAEHRFAEEEVELLYRLVLEFQSELEILGYDVQDYAILLGLGNGAQLGGLFTDRQLTYSSQALAAVLKSGALSGGQFESQNLDDLFAPAMVDDEAAPEGGGEPRSLWTGSFPISANVLAARGTLVAEERDTVPELAALNIGGLQVSGAIWASGSSGEAWEVYPQLESSAGYGLVLRYGDLSLSTMRDHYPADSEDGSAESQRTATSLDVSVGLRNSVLLSAGYTYFDSAQSDNGEELQAMASVGVELPITSGGTLRLGMSSAWPRGTFDLIQAGSPLDDTAVRSTAELGLSYDFENETTLRLNYRLIDFTTVNPSYGATAEFSIKF